MQGGEGRAGRGFSWDALQRRMLSGGNVGFLGVSAVRAAMARSELEGEGRTGRRALSTRRRCSVPPGLGFGWGSRRSGCHGGGHALKAHQPQGAGSVVPPGEGSFAP